ncbi:MAG: hypothetical protein K9H49_10775 [Bacteroidales bacterium]|nr:hypothetical protein [Bacteroidales bacterium]MCF8391911.1 hypothetical protein [Bacteroidales bacterium]
MKITQESRKLINIIFLALVTTSILLLTAFYYFSQKEEKLIDINKAICKSSAEHLAWEIESDIDNLYHLGLSNDSSLSLAKSKTIDALLTELVSEHLRNAFGMEGGVYINKLDDFMGYAYPTSPPPIPVYGPPPRSFNIIKDQCVQSVGRDTSIIQIHSFDPAIFPLATSPIHVKSIPVAAVWVRVHIERDLPLVKFRRVINLVTVISLIGFTFMAMFSFFLRNGIKNIKNELKNTTANPKYRLKRRGGWFGFIPASINNMLDLIEKDNENRHELEKKLQQKEKLASLGTMVAGVAHEVKTPLAAIKIRVQMWKREVENNPELEKNISKESLEMIICEIDRLTNLVNRLVIFSRPIIKNLSETDLGALIEEVISFFDLNNFKDDIRITLKSQKEIPRPKLDANSFKQVIINIITNSLESVDRKGEIHIELKHDFENNSVIVEISDNGNGIPDEFINKVFDPFFTLKDKGTGLGLSISHEIISAHNGSISFRKNSPKGVICIISIPIQ